MNINATVDIVNWSEYNGEVVLKMNGDIDRKEMTAYVQNRKQFDGREKRSVRTGKPFFKPSIQLTLSDKYRKRSTGKNSQNTKLHGILRDIAIETGNDIAVVKREVKRQAVSMGYPVERTPEGDVVMDKLFNEPVPQSEAVCTTVEESILIDCAIRMASELGIVLEGV